MSAERTLAASTVGLGVRSFLAEEAAGRLPPRSPVASPRRPKWDRALDRLGGSGDPVTARYDEIMAAIEGET